MPPRVHGNNASDIRLPSIGVPTYSNLEKYLDASNSAGIFEGGIISDSGSGQIDISAAYGVIRTTNSGVGHLVSFDIGATTNVDLTDNSMNYVYINYNAGSPVWAVTTDYTSIDLQTEIIVGRVYRAATMLWIGTFGQRIQDTPLRDLYRLQTLRRFEHANGDEISTPSARYIALTAGIHFANYEPISTPAWNSSGAGRFDYWYRNGSGGWTRVATQQNIDNAYWDDGTGTLNTLNGPNHYGVHWVYRCADGSVHVQYGQSSYTTLANARLATVPTPPPLFSGLCTIVGRVIIQNTASSITEVASVYTTTFTTSTPAVHNDLSGLQGGTASQYYHLTSDDYAVRNLPVVEVTGTTQAMAIRTRYVANNAAQVVFTLPSSAVIGDFVEVEGYGAGGWKIAQNAGQLVIFQSVVSTTGTGGYLASGYRYDCVRLRCVVANTTWTVVSATGEITVI